MYVGCCFAQPVSVGVLFCFSVSLFLLSFKGVIRKMWNFDGMAGWVIGSVNMARRGQ